MTTDIEDIRSAKKKWFRKEQGRFLREARRKAGLSIDTATKETRLDVGPAERGEVDLPACELIQLVEFYLVSVDDFVDWQFYISTEINRFTSEP